MEQNDKLQELNEIFQDIFDDDTLLITEDTSSDDIADWDSLAHIRLIAAVEKAFRVRFSMNEIPDLKTVRSILARLP